MSRIMDGSKENDCQVVILTAQVNRNRSRQEAIDATGRTQQIDRRVVESMPTGKNDEVELVFFRIERWDDNGFISNDDLEKEFRLRDLIPADPISVSAVNEACGDFADERPHATHWKDAEGNWCDASFYSRNGIRKIVILRSGGCNFYSSMWFVGVCK